MKILGRSLTANVVASLVVVFVSFIVNFKSVSFLAEKLNGVCSVISTMAEFIRGGASLPHRDKMNFINGCENELDGILPSDDFDPFFTNEQEEDTTDADVITAPPDNL